MNFSELKNEVERLIGGDVPRIDWEELVKFFGRKKELSLPESFTHEIAKYAAKEYRRLKAAPPQK